MEDRLPLNLLSWLNRDPSEPGPTATTEDNNPISEVELAVYPPMCNTLPDLPRQPGEGEMVVYKVTQKTARAEVVKRDDDLLTPQEVQQHWKEVQEAMLKELQTWNKLNCFSRKPRAQA